MIYTKFSVSDMLPGQRLHQDLPDILVTSTLDERGCMEMTVVLTVLTRGCWMIVMRSHCSIIFINGRSMKSLTDKIAITALLCPNEEYPLQFVHCDGRKVTTECIFWNVGWDGKYIVWLEKLKVGSWTVPLCRSSVVSSIFSRATKE
jgi:hypothetical protein